MAIVGDDAMTIPDYIANLRSDRLSAVGRGSAGFCVDAENYRILASHNIASEATGAGMKPSSKCAAAPSLQRQRRRSSADPARCFSPAYQ
jgi:hypothetical protein